MKRIFFIVPILIFVLCGCATVAQKETLPQPEPSLPRAVATEGPKVEKITEQSPQVTPPVKGASLELHNLVNEEMKEYDEKNGVVFGKAVFKGVLNTRYAKLMFKNIHKPEEVYQLIIGDKSLDNNFPWDKGELPPEYFFVEFPAGQYVIDSLSIPVGSTMATEKLNISFDVIPDKITYIGTLDMNGTKEKIKLGGVPVIKPGFEYILNIRDDREEALQEFQRKYQEAPDTIVFQLMVNNNIPSEKGEEK